MNGWSEARGTIYEHEHEIGYEILAGIHTVHDFAGAAPAIDSIRFPVCVRHCSILCSVPLFGVCAVANPFPIDLLGRKCGECYACCVHLGIEALKKWPGQSCKHLDGSHGPLTRCTVYDNRPHACVGYWCAWIGGFGSDDYRPDKSGLLATFYPPTEQSLGRFNASIHVIDEKLSGIILDADSKLNRMIAILLEEGCAEIRVVFSPVTRGERMYQLKNGKVYVGLILPPIARDDYEDLNFVVRNEPVAAFHTGRAEETEA